MGEFMFATGIECSYPTIENGRWRVDQMAETGHYRYWRARLRTGPRDRVAIPALRAAAAPGLPRPGPLRLGRSWTR